MSNRLANETSPYLLQHKDNPVDWYPWGPEALARASEEKKPIFLSIGYSACHWCHVMEHESFEDPETAAIMNKLFVSIKVDREERPDLDSIYMDAVQAMTGHGGWPMSVFLTPEGAPFYGGTYFPPTPRHGMMSFPQVLEAVATAYAEQPDRVMQGAQEMRRFLGESAMQRPSSGEPNAGVLDAAARTLVPQMDRVHGGTEGAPKFPQPMTLEFMLRAYKRTGDHGVLGLAELALEKMARGGVYDQLGGGFHRYSVDDRWLVPHFEKMLYDNAQLARLYLSAWQLTGNLLYRRICTETLDYVLREMTSPEGGFYSAQDADSEGQEGKFYVWTPKEVYMALGPEDGRLFNLLYDVTQRGNWEGHSILNLPRTPETVAANAGVSVEDIERVMREGREKLYKARAERVWPGRDDKVLVGWNGLMLRAFAEAAAVLGDESYREVAVLNAEFILSTLVERGEMEGGQQPASMSQLRLYRTYKDGKAHIPAFAEDYAFYAAGLVSLYETTFDTQYILTARNLIETLLKHFWDEKGGGFYTTSDFHEALVARPKELYDNAIPSANSVGAETLLRLYLLTAEPEYERYAVQTMRPLIDVLGRAPTAFGHMLNALDFYVGPQSEIALIGEPDSDEMREMLRAVHKVYHPNKVVAAAAPTNEEATKVVPLLVDRPQVKGKATAYVCRNYVCEAPTTDAAEVSRLLAARGGTAADAGILV